MKILALITMVGLLFGGVASAQSGFDLRIAGPGKISATGTSVTVPVSVRCQTGSNVMEAHVSVSQDDAWGMRGFTPVCDGRWHKLSVSVNSFGGSFEPGFAQASGYLLICNSDFSQCNSVSSGKRIRVQ